MSPPATSPRPSANQLRELRGRLQLLIRDAGLTDFSPGASHPHAPFWQLEPKPLVVPAAEWAVIEAACAQRARLVNAFLKDAYGEQRLLRAKLLPPEVVLGDPFFRRPCCQLEPHRDHPATLLRFDLVRTPDSWLFTDTSSNTPIGLSYAVQNRRFLAQEASDLYGSLPAFQTIVGFPLQLLDSLHLLNRKGKSEASIIVLTSGPQDPFYSEHSFLARKMGLPLAQGDDLLVVDNRVYFKTIAGLEPVDVIYRRLNDAHIDPVVFSTSREGAGVPGLMQCIRSGTVVLANAIGSGLAENRALNAFLPRLYRFYLGQKALLPTVPTLTCGDPDQLELILERYADLRIRPTHDQDPLPGVEPLPYLAGPSGLAQEVARNPFAYVAQESVQLVPIDATQVHSPGYTLSVFALMRGHEIVVMPGGLVHLGAGTPPRDRVGVCADAVVLIGDQPESPSRDWEDAGLVPPPRVLGSRSAESLLWLGRYLERAEATARMLQIFDDVALEEVPARDRHRWLPVWRGLFEATGHEPEDASAQAGAGLQIDPLWRMTLDSRHPSSLLSSVASAAENARKLRDHVSPECWAVLTRLHARLAVLRRPEGDNPAAPSGPNDLRKRNALAATQAVANDINAFLGTAERTMLHDAGWGFMCLGQHLERAIMTCSALRHVLVFFAEEHSRSNGRSLQRENPELSALLRMLGSQDAYRRMFQSRTLPHLVGRLFLREASAPRSLYHNLLQIRDALRNISDHIGDASPCGGAQEAEALLVLLNSLTLDAHFFASVDRTSAAPYGENLEALLQVLLDRLLGLHPLVSDQFFSHQARLSGQPTQETLAL
ncbi:circularly permuted type 2 ATP-grasp protein [Nibricoccus sp. IMCC34717]|uniref:circularly permuted type 2 ATP-grasp protein n=1 Tax=Nibricoccus sp. IMCC34717 TaxID=3034021 RepID=UPI0038517E6D